MRVLSAARTAALLAVTLALLFPTVLATFVPPGAGISAPATAALPRDGPVVLYQTWPLATLEMQEYAAKYPNLARLHSAGRSHDGLDLWVLEITNFVGGDRPRADREVLWFDGTTHGNEQLGGQLAWEIVYFLLDEYETNETARWIVDNRVVYVLPIVNPDGNMADTRFNARGVNINRNWPAGWGALDEVPVFNNPGPYPASEPETQAIIRFIDAMPRKPDYFNSFHTGIVLWLYPYGYADELPADDVVYRRICEEIWPGDERCGPTYSTIYPASGVAVDWGYEALGAISWTYEVSDDQFTIAQTGSVREALKASWIGVEHALLHVHRYGAHLTVLDARLVRVGDAYELHAEIANDGYGPAPWAEVALAAPGGGSGTVRLDRIEPGSSARVVLPVPGTLAPGLGELKLDYAKRIHLQPVAEKGLPVQIGLDGNRLRLDAIGAVETAATAEDAGRFVPAPGGALAALALGLAGAVVLRRRR